MKAYWSALWWEWPYDDDGVTRYQRIVVLMSEGPSTEFRGLGQASINTQAPAFATTDQFLVSVGRQTVRSQLSGIAAGVTQGGT